MPPCSPNGSMWANPITHKSVPRIQTIDDRNFVKKAVNWALRQIGKRSFHLNRKAIETAVDFFLKLDALLFPVEEAATSNR